MFKKMTFEKSLLVIILFLFLGQSVYYKIKSDRQENKIDNLKIEMKVLQEEKYKLAQEDIDKIVAVVDKNIQESKVAILKYTKNAINALKEANEISYATNVTSEECQTNLEKCDDQNFFLRKTIEEKDLTTGALTKALDNSEEKSNLNLKKFNICTDQLNKFKEDWKKDISINKKLKKKLEFWKTAGKVGIGATIFAVIMTLID